MRWRLILPALGLLLFAAEAYESNRDWNIQSSPHRYVWWSFIRLDSDPLNRSIRKDKAGWDLPYQIVDPGYLANASLLSGLPVFVASAFIMAGLSRLGVSQVLTFMISTPVLLFAWYYFLGWLLDRWRARRRVVNN